ncbi:MAG: hypothetical protein ACKODX_09650, partial [Gemmata sp.]
MFQLNQLLRQTLAVLSITLVAEAATAQSPGPADAPLPTAVTPAPQAVVPAACWRGPFGSRSAPRTQSVPCAPCAPGTLPPGVTTPGTTPPETNPPGTKPPGLEQPAQPPAPAPDFGDRSRGADIGSGLGLNSPNLFGDLFGAPPSQVFVRQTMPGYLNGNTVVFAVGGVSGSAPGTAFGNLRNGTVSLRDPSGLKLLAVPSVTVAGIPVPVSNPVPLSALGISGSFTENVTAGPNTLYTPTGVNAASANYVVQYFLGTTSARPAGVPFTIPGIVPVGAGRDALAAPIERAMTPQARLESLTVGPVQAALVGSELRYQA